MLTFLERLYQTEPCSKFRKFDIYFDGTQTQTETAKTNSFLFLERHLDALVLSHPLSLQLLHTGNNEITNPIE
jgi:hypothetical protein